MSYAVLEQEIWGGEGGQGLCLLQQINESGRSVFRSDASKSDQFLKMPRGHAASHAPCLV